MPGMNMTGPIGAGPGTGRCRGRCRNTVTSEAIGWGRDTACRAARQTGSGYGYNGRRRRMQSSSTQKQEKQGEFIDN